MLNNSVADGVRFQTSQDTYAPADDMKYIVTVSLVNNGSTSAYLRQCFRDSFVRFKMEAYSGESWKSSYGPFCSDAGYPLLKIEPDSTYRDTLTIDYNQRIFPHLRYLSEKGKYRLSTYLYSETGEIVDSVHSNVFTLQLPAK